MSVQALVMTIANIISKADICKCTLMKMAKCKEISLSILENNERWVWTDGNGPREVCSVVKARKPFTWRRFHPRQESNLAWAAKSQLQREAGRAEELSRRIQLSYALVSSGNASLVLVVGELRDETHRNREDTQRLAYWLYRPIYSETWKQFRYRNARTEFNGQNVSSYGRLN